MIYSHPISLTFASAVAFALGVAVGRASPRSCWWVEAAEGMQGRGDHPVTSRSRTRVGLPLLRLCYLALLIRARGQRRHAMIPPSGLRRGRSGVVDDVPPAGVETISRAWLLTLEM